jgi:hypothetical protein
MRLVTVARERGVPSSAGASPSMRTTLTWWTSASPRSTSRTTPTVSSVAPSAQTAKIVQLNSVRFFPASTRYATGPATTQYPMKNTPARNTSPPARPSCSMPRSIAEPRSIVFWAENLARFISTYRGLGSGASISGPTRIRSLRWPNTLSHT